MSNSNDNIDNLAQTFFITLVFTSLLSDSYIVCTDFMKNNFIKKKIKHVKKIFDVFTGLALNNYKNDEDGNIIIDNKTTPSTNPFDLEVSDDEDDILFDDDEIIQSLIDPLNSDKLKCDKELEKYTENNSIIEEHDSNKNSTEKEKIIIDDQHDIKNSENILNTCYAKNLLEDEVTNNNIIQDQEIKNNSENINSKKEKNNFREKSEKNKELKINITNPNSVKIEKNEKNEQVLSRLVEKKINEKDKKDKKLNNNNENIKDIDTDNEYLSKVKIAPKDRIIQNIDIIESENKSMRKKKEKK